MTTYEKTCEFCGAAFGAKRSHARYCQEECSTQGWIEEQVYRIKTTGECHADDLIDLYPEGEVALCRRLATAQFGSLASRKLIFKDGWRPTKSASRKGGGAWIWKFTEKGQDELGSLVGVNRSSGDGRSPGGAAVDPGESSTSTGQSQDKSESGRHHFQRPSAAGAGQPVPLFGASALERMSDAA